MPTRDRLFELKHGVAVAEIHAENLMFVEYAAGAPLKHAMHDLLVLRATRPYFSHMAISVYYIDLVAINDKQLCRSCTSVRTILRYRNF